MTRIRRVRPLRRDPGRRAWPRRPALERLSRTERPPLRRPLATIPMELGDWVGRDEPVDPDDRRASPDQRLPQPGLREPQAARAAALLWINYSRHGHEPAALAGDLPAVGGLDQGRVADAGSSTIAAPAARPLPVTRLGYAQGELVQGVGFWYYIFGEGQAGALRPRPADHQPEQPRTDDPRARG